MIFFFTASSRMLALTLVCVQCGRETKEDEENAKQMKGVRVRWKLVLSHSSTCIVSSISQNMNISCVFMPSM